MSQVWSGLGYDLLGISFKRKCRLERIEILHSVRKEKKNNSVHFSILLRVIELHSRGKPNLFFVSQKLGVNILLTLLIINSSFCVCVLHFGPKWEPSALVIEYVFANAQKKVKCPICCIRKVNDMIIFDRVTTSK